MTITFIDSVAEVGTLVEKLSSTPSQVAELYLDLEGDNLSRHGSISLLTLHDRRDSITYLVDVTKLGREAFSTESPNGWTLRSILESPVIVKIFFDVRNDSNALFFLFDVKLAGIFDLQLVELAARSFDKRCVNGLSKCIERDAGLDYQHRAAWLSTKNAGRRLFAPELGGTYAVFDIRPLTNEIREYCAQDVAFMPLLLARYCNKLCDRWLTKVEEETVTRIRLSQTLTFNGQGRHMALGPTHWNSLGVSTTEASVRDRVMKLSRPSGGNVGFEG
jgi:exonuclease 3'-5' domain-containing protein 1